MSLLMPDLERQLRRAAREQRLRAEAGRWPRRALTPRRSLGTVFAAVAVALALALAAVIALSVHHDPSRVTAAGHGSSTPATATSGAGQIAIGVGSNCGPGPAGAHESQVASGAIGKRPWQLDLDLKPDAGKVTGGMHLGRFRLSGRKYPFCTGLLYAQLIDIGSRGILYGFVPGDKRGRVTIGNYGAHLTETTGPVAGGTLFVAELPKPACYYGSLTVAATVANGGESTVLRFGACRPNRLVTEGVVPSGNSTLLLPVTPPPVLNRAQTSTYNQGEAAVGQAGCLGCHTIAGQGNNGPGPNLTTIGSRLSAPQLEHELRDPKAPMPSFKAMPAKQFRALVYFLSQLRGK
jgi:mono/diheme cytochrome c family protein